MRLRVPVASLVVSLSACGGGTGRGAVDVSKVVDRATLLPAGSAGGLVFAPLGEEPLPARGAVESVGPHTHAGWWRVTLAGTGDADQRSFVVEGKASPFSVGQVLALERKRVQVGRHAYDEGDQLLGEDGTLLALSFSGGATAPEGWSARQVGDEGDGCRVLVEHVGVQALIPTGEWRRVAAPDGTWDIRGKCPAPTPSSRRSVPDFVPPPLVVEASRVR